MDPNFRVRSNVFLLMAAIVTIPFLVLLPLGLLDVYDFDVGYTAILARAISFPLITLITLDRVRAYSGDLELGLLAVESSYAIFLVGTLLLVANPNIDVIPYAYAYIAISTGVGMAFIIYKARRLAFAAPAILSRLLAALLAGFLLAENFVAIIVYFVAALYVYVLFTLILAIALRVYARLFIRILRNIDSYFVRTTYSCRL